MEAAKIKEILKKQFGINSEEEFNAAVESMVGINLGIFTMPINGRSDCEQETDRISA